MKFVYSIYKIFRKNFINSVYTKNDKEVFLMKDIKDGLKDIVLFI